MITTRINTNTKFILAEYYGQTNQLKTTPLQYEIIKDKTVIARFTTPQERDVVLNEMNIKPPPPPTKMILNINQYAKIPVATTGNTKYIDGELHYEIIINKEKHYAHYQQLTPTDTQ